MFCGTLASDIGGKTRVTEFINAQKRIFYKKVTRLQVSGMQAGSVIFDSV